MAPFAVEITVALSDSRSGPTQWRATFSAEAFAGRSFGATLRTPVFECCATIFAEFLTRPVLAPAIRTAHRLTRDQLRSLNPPWLDYLSPDVSGRPPE